MFDQHTPGRDIIDLRSVLDEYEALIGMRDDGEDLDDSDQEYIEAVEELGEQIDLECSAQNEPVLILEGKAFEDYARDLAEDIGAIDRQAGWPADYIDWEAAADALAMDYTSVEFGGFDYLTRAY
jgi:hypothetical protein